MGNSVDAFVVDSGTHNFQVVEARNGVLVVSRYSPSSMIFAVFRNRTRISSFRPVTAGSGLTVGLNYPLSLAVDTRGYILVADSSNNRIVVVNPALTAGRVLPLPANITLRCPYALSLDNSRGRLYVGENCGQNRLLVFHNVTRVDSWCSITSRISMLYSTAK